MKAAFSVSKMLRSARGQALIELTLITPLLLLLLLGTVEVATVISVHQDLTHLTREGANLTSRGVNPNAAMSAVIASAAPRIRNDNTGQWRVIYSLIQQDPDIPCPPVPCTYIVTDQIGSGNLNQTSQVGSPDQPVQVGGIDSLSPNQIFHAIEVYYDYGPDAMTFISNTIDTLFYDRTIFTNVSALPSS